MPFCRRYHVFEINDQPWWPPLLAEKVQNALTMSWINRLPIIQPTSPAALVTDILIRTLKDRVGDYVYVDFASGAGGPTPYLEKQLNDSLKEQGHKAVDFVLTDIKPNIPAWTAAAKKSHHLTFYPKSVDATNAPSAEVLLRNVTAAGGKKVMRLFSLCFHHFDDHLAAKVLQNSIETSDGFCIFELVARDIKSLLLLTLGWLMLMIITPFFFIRDPVQMFFTYLVPWVPFVVVFDGYMSILRMRTPEEIRALLRSRVPAEELENWKFRTGTQVHSWPLGYIHWVICYKED